MYFKAHPHDGHQWQEDGVDLHRLDLDSRRVARTDPCERHRDLIVVHHASSVEFNLAVHGEFYTFLDVAEPRVSQLADSVIEAAGLRAAMSADAAHQANRAATDLKDASVRRNASQSA